MDLLVLFIVTFYSLILLMLKDQKAVMMNIVYIKRESHDFLQCDLKHGSHKGCLQQLIRFIVSP